MLGVLIHRLEGGVERKERRRSARDERVWGSAASRFAALGEWVPLHVVQEIFVNQRSYWLGFIIRCLNHVGWESWHGWSSFLPPKTHAFFFLDPRTSHSLESLPVVRGLGKSIDWLLSVPKKRTSSSRSSAGFYYYTYF